MPNSLARAVRRSTVRDTIDLYAILSHELRTPLTTILGANRMIASGSTDRDAVERAESAIIAARRLQAFADNIAIWLERDAGAFRLDTCVFRPSVLLNSAIADARAAAQAKSVELTCLISPGIDRERLGDPNRLRIILDNLLDNAVKFTDRGAVNVVASVEDDRLVIEVEDTGVGIDPRRVRRILAPFVQLDASARRRYEGAGLGLAVANFLAEAMQGGLAITGVPGLGTTVRLDIAAPAAEAQDPFEDDVQPLKVLVVEDNHANRRIIELVLRELGHNAQGVEGGREALACLDADTFDLIVLDLHMPDMDGFQTARAVRARKDTNADVPIVALSADTRPNIRTLVAEAGMSAYLSKPLDVANLALCVSGLAQTRRLSRVA